ncbi:lipopolysaccharide biosynthesis protein [Castellaniella sp.]|uniref:lipopolysaccharide biosynthesis protein n=1 Tax=Castellaniella sp. TaxID=1955812 RepID=UPI003C76983F
MFDRLFNLGLRGATLGSKFVLIFFLARFLEPEDVGQYGLMVASILYALYLLGLDFYAYSTRELLRRDRSDWGALLRSQGALTLLLYATVLPALLLVFYFEFLPWSLAPWFYLLLVVEHLNQEAFRFLVAVSRQLTASVALFLRQGLWAVAIIAIMALYPESRTLDGVFAAWVLGGVASLAMTIPVLRGLGMGGWRTPADWGWIKQGLVVAVPLLIGTLALRSLFTVDRYWYMELNSPSALGAYVLFAGLAGSLMTFLDAGVYSFSYPAMIRASHAGDKASFTKEVRRMVILTLVLCILFAGGGFVLLEPMLAWIGRSTYTEYSALFYWLLLPVCLYALGMIPHYMLYAKGHDRPIVYSHVAAVFAFGLTVASLVRVSSEFAVPWGLSASFLMIFFWKTAAVWRISKNSIDIQTSFPRTVH